MNKTLTINISGIVFNIEEDAYESLRSYLGKIKKHFQNEEGCDEIVADIESRLAEILRAKINAGKQVLVPADINEAIAIMGQPEDFAEGSSTEENKKQETHTNTQQNYYGNKRRRVFRDPDSKILGGVCSGIGNYFDIDPLWIRLALVVMFFGFGSGFLLYIILWIIIPEAKTTAEKLEMRGEPVDVNTISKTIKDEAENLKGRAKDFGNDVKKHMSGDNTGKFVDLLRQIFSTIITIFAKLLGVFFVFLGIMFFVGLFSILFGFGTIDNLSIREFINSFAGADFPVFWAKTAIALTIGIPSVMLLYKGMKMILGIKFHNRWINISAGVLWTVGIILGLCIAGEFAQQFSQSASLKQQVETRWSAKDTLFIKANPNYTKTDADVDFNMDNDRWLINVSQKNRSMWWGRPKLRIIASENDSLYVFVIKSAKGTEKPQAALRAKNISYALQQTDSLLMLDKYSSFPGEDKYRAQEVEVLVKVPRNKVIYLDHSVKKLLYDVDNTDEIFDEDMVGKYWRMTENGLDCQNCAESGRKHSKNGIVNVEDEDAKVRIDANGIEVNSKDANVKIDEDGIKIDSKENK